MYRAGSTTAASVSAPEHVHRCSKLQRHWRQRITTVPCMRGDRPWLEPDCPHFWTDIRTYEILVRSFEVQKQLSKEVGKSKKRKRQEVQKQRAELRGGQSGEVTAFLLGLRSTATLWLSGQARDEAIHGDERTHRLLDICSVVARSNKLRSHI